MSGEVFSAVCFLLSYFGSIIGLFILAYRNHAEDKKQLAKLEKELETHTKVLNILKGKINEDN